MYADFVVIFVIASLAIVSGAFQLLAWLDTTPAPKKRRIFKVHVYKDETAYLSSKIVIK